VEGDDLALVRVIKGVKYVVVSASHERCGPSTLTRR
jgi:hypothetical protein